MVVHILNMLLELRERYYLIIENIKCAFLEHTYLVGEFQIGQPSLFIKGFQQWFLTVLMNSFQEKVVYKWPLVDVIRFISQWLDKLIELALVTLRNFLGFKFDFFLELDLFEVAGIPLDIVINIVNTGFCFDVKYWDNLNLTFKNFCVV